MLRRTRGRGSHLPLAIRTLRVTGSPRKARAGMNRADPATGAHATLVHAAMAPAVAATATDHSRRDVFPAATAAKPVTVARNSSAPRRSGVFVPKLPGTP